MTNQEDIYMHEHLETATINKCSVERPLQSNGTGKYSSGQPKSHTIKRAELKKQN